ncbi:hypothetical protein FLBR109950_02785 [Flavobacterium branchiophilum]|uniref:Uncharacterized protein n=1 Tax=Flavobacterium branchiophilum TaxID=55197 RepID=A0A543G3B7_9FLAO|nr:hypothetical protein BC670_1405 [Flavobacterium branchiophilum]
MFQGLNIGTKLLFSIQIRTLFYKKTNYDKKSTCSVVFVKV